MNAAVHSLRALTRGMTGDAVLPDIAVSGLALDSRRVRSGDLFLAVPGLVVDGRDYIDASIAAGAVAVLTEPGGAPRADAGVPVFEVSGLKRQLGALADRFFDQPSRRLCVIGVTGTNGKTTCSHMLAQALAALGGESAVMGTVGNGRPGALAPAALTTADAISVHGELARLLADGVQFVAMEVSSHALDQGRVDKVAFDFAVFTNLSQDHLDYHDDMDAYGAAKARLFALPDLSACVVNVDDAFGRRLADTLDADRLWSYGESEDARVRRTAVTVTGGALAMDVDCAGASVRLEVPLTGRFNADNALAVFATLLAMGFEAPRVAVAMGSVQAVPGRMERFEAPGRPAVVVDYAHTPDALEKALEACRESGAGALWVVFGCGGDRDRAKRAPMGAIAARLADHVILTNDNPRNEDPLAIIDDIGKGADGRQTVLPDRGAAIAHAVANAAPGDIVLVAGKGHESGQSAGGVTRPFSDRDCVRELLGSAP